MVAGHVGQQKSQRLLETQMIDRRPRPPRANAAVGTGTSIGHYGLLLIDFPSDRYLTMLGAAEALTTKKK